VGHKVHPNGFRLGVYRNWEAKWFATDKEFKPLLLEDVRLRRMLLARLKNAGVARIETERSSSALTVTLHTAKPGIVIGKGGTSVDQLRDELERITGKRVRVTIQEIKKPELSAQLVAENVAAQLEKRIAFRRAIKQSLMKTMRAGAQGVKIRVKGRLGGSEMARVEWNREGRVPLHTLKADIDFGQTEAKTTFGRIGVSAWVYTGNFPTEAPPKPQVAEEPAEAGTPVAATLAEAPAQLSELVKATVAAPVVPAAPAPEPVAAPAATPAPATTEAARPKRVRATKAAAASDTPAAAATDTTAAAEAKPKRTTRARSTATDKAAAPKTPRPRATRKKE
jgi:small subunit ribosomal protein S3